jgi:RecB family exonuclease
LGISLSFSAAQKYLLSPYSWYAHYMLRLRPVAISSPLVWGSAIDEGLNALLAPPLDRSPEALVKAKEAFNKAWKIANHNGRVVDLSKPGAVKFSKTEITESLEIEEKVEGIDRTWAWMKKKGELILEAYAEQIVPQLQEVYEVQSKVDLKNDTDDSFIGIVDVIAKYQDKVVIFDNKTSGSKYKADSVVTSAQLSTYFEAKKEQYKPDAAGYIVLQKKLRKKHPRVQIDIIIDDINEELIEQTFQNYDEALAGIKAGKFECSGMCKQAFCGCSYQKYCESGQTDMTGLEFVKEKK